VLRTPNKRPQRAVRKLNPLTNVKAMLRLNPYAAVLKRKAILTIQKKNRDTKEFLAKKHGKPVQKTEKEIRYDQMLEKRKANIKKAKAAKPKKAKPAKKAPVAAKK
jgi:large subunit ribosomal protein L4e